MARTVGVQSYTYRHFPVLKMLDEVRAAGLEAIELWPGHLRPEAPDAEAERLLEEVAARGLRICGYGVVRLGPNTPGQLRLARRLGCDYLSVDVAPNERSVQAEACALAEQLGIKLGIHNHGPGHHYSTAASVAAVLAHNPPVLGACVDTGHFLRSGEEPVAVIGQLRPRVHAVHLKDFVDADTEVLPGTGRLDLPATLRALEEAGMASPFVLEYEADENDPTPAVRQAGAAVRAALPGA